MINKLFLLKLVNKLSIPLFFENLKVFKANLIKDTGENDDIILLNYWHK